MQLIHIPHRFCTFASPTRSQRCADLVDQIEILRWDFAAYLCQEPAGPAEEAQIGALLDELALVIESLEEDVMVEKVHEMTGPQLRRWHAQLLAKQQAGTITKAEAAVLAVLKQKLGK